MSLSQFDVCFVSRIVTIVTQHSLEYWQGEEEAWRERKRRRVSEPIVSDLGELFVIYRHLKRLVVGGLVATEHLFVLWPGRWRAVTRGGKR